MPTHREPSALTSPMSLQCECLPSSIATSPHRTRPRGSVSAVAVASEGPVPGNPGLKPYDRFLSREALQIGGGGGIRTHGRREPSVVFKTTALNHSATPPRLKQPQTDRLSRPVHSTARPPLHTNEVNRLEHSIRLPSPARPCMFPFCFHSAPRACQYIPARAGASDLRARSAERALRARVRARADRRHLGHAVLANE